MSGAAGRGCQRPDTGQEGARGAGGHPTLGAFDRCRGPRALHLRRAEAERFLRQCQAENHRGAATAQPTTPTRSAAYTKAPEPTADCAARLRAERLPAKAADELAFLFEGHIGTALKSWNDPTAKAALSMAKTLCGYAAQGDTYRALTLLTKYERDREGFSALLWTLDQLCSAVLRRPAYGQEQCGG